MPHEIFLCAVVADPDALKARALLGGFTETSGQHHQFIRVQHYEPQDLTVKGFTTIKQLQKERAPTTQQWQELHQILAKQPSVLQVRTNVTEQVQNAVTRGDPTTVRIPAEKPHILRWTDLPDPPNPRLPFITQRKIVDIADPRAVKILVENKFKAKSHLLEESYHWWRNDVEYALTRTFVISLDPNTDDSPSQQISNPASLEPATPFWILYVRTKVDSTSSASMPERMKQAQAVLVQVREQLLGVFDFKAFDRRCHDTRVQGPRPA
ncbi:hypothetical protein VTI74DRAFT_2326 [Chaetomium olivicolor]